MDLLLGLFIFLTLTVLLLTYLLYKTKGDNKKHNQVFIANVVLVFVLSFLAYSSLPSNFMTQRVIAIVWIVLATVASALKFKGLSKSLIPEIMLSVALFAALVQTLYI